MCQEYNGYTNYETWNVNLHIDNDHGLYSYWNERAQEILDEAEGTQYRTYQQEARYQLAEELKDYHFEYMPELHGTYSDLLSAALGVVDWYQIAENLLDDKTPTDEDEELEEV